MIEKQLNESKYNIFQWGDETFRTLKSSDKVWDKLLPPLTEPAIEFNRMLILDFNDNGINIHIDKEGKVKEAWSNNENKDGRV